MSKSSRLREHSLLLSRFPKGSGKGDPLAYQMNLGSSYRKIDNLSFGKLPKPVSVKRWSEK